MMKIPKSRRGKLVWYFCDGDCGTVLVDELRARGCGICRCSGTMRYLEMTEEEYVKYRPLLEELGVQGFVKSLPPNRPLHNRGDLIQSWEREMKIS